MADLLARSQLRTRPSLFERRARACPLPHRDACGQTLRQPKQNPGHKAASPTCGHVMSYFNADINVLH